MNRFEYDAWYVYELIDPRTKAVFYIGKSATPKARLADHKSNPASSAFGRIKEIRADGHEVEQYIIAQFNTEAECLEYEGYLIRKTPGLVNKMGYETPPADVWFRRPVVGPKDLTYVSTENQPVPDEETMAQTLSVQLPHISGQHIREILRVQAMMFCVDSEYVGLTDE